MAKAPEIVHGPVKRSEGKGQPYREVWYIRCPNCGLEGMADMDQMEGRVSIDCPDCPYHETHRIFRAAQGEPSEPITTGEG